MKKIILSGYMGSGKSTIARLLQAKTGMKMIDLDDFIEKKTRLSIPEIFASKGEIHFRKLEHQALKEILQSDESLILSLGGGTPCYANNHELLKGQDMIWVYLKASPDTLYDRLVSGAESRPLLAGKNQEEMKEFIAQHLFERSYYYNQAGHKIITDGKSPSAVASEIEKILA
jgi:shikimate kinase